MTAIGRDNLRKAIAAASSELTRGLDVPEANHDLSGVLFFSMEAASAKNPTARLAGLDSVRKVANRAYHQEKARQDEAAELAAELAAIG